MHGSSFWSYSYPNMHRMLWTIALILIKLFYDQWAFLLAQWHFTAYEWFLWPYISFYSRITIDFLLDMVLEVHWHLMVKFESEFYKDLPSHELHSIHSKFHLVRFSFYLDRLIIENQCSEPLSTVFLILSTLYNYGVSKYLIISFFYFCVSPYLYFFRI